ncbi:MAG: hypothetical protein Q9183_006317, partial [Haloplaca sp. 2 TL-2023]
MSPEESRKLKNKARLQDAASIGIAALSIKGAMGNWKEMQEQRKECLEFDRKREERRERREWKREERMRGVRDGQQLQYYANSEPGMARGQG